VNAPQNFDVAEKAKVFAGFFEQGQPMWDAMSKCADIEMPTPSSILDLGSGPGEPACYFAQKFNVQTVCSDLAPAMVELAKKRVSAKGLDSIVECKVMNMEDLSAIPDSSTDLVTAQMAYMFVPDKGKALGEALRVLKPGGVLIANVWVDFDLIRIAGGLVASVTGPPTEAPPFNPVGPLSLADASTFDALLTDAGFELTPTHNTTTTHVFELGSASTDQSFKMCALPVWDVLDEFEASGKFPDAWAKAQTAYPGVIDPFTDSNGVVSIEGVFRIAVAKKPE